MAANNETGVIQPWREILSICKAYEVPFFTDAVQFIGKMPLKGLGDCDYVSGAAHKFGGPRGVGFLKIPHRKSNHAPAPRRQTGRRPPRRNGKRRHHRRDAGRARGPRETDCPQRTSIAQVWRDNFERELLRTQPGTSIIGANVPRLWNTVSALMPDGDRKHQWVVRLDKAGFAVSTGSACTTGKEEPSQVLAAMGLKAAQAVRAVRFSAGWETNEADWEALVKGVAKVHEEMLHAKACHSPRYTARAVQVSATTTSVSSGSFGFSFFQIHPAISSLVGFFRPGILFR